MSEQITALDGTFLELEDADPAAHMHIGGVLVFEPLEGGGAPSLDELAEQISRRVALLPRYRQRLAHPDAGLMTWQHWEDDPEFHPMRHLRRAALPAPGGWEELLELAGHEFSQRLDRDRPLWEVVLITGLANDHWALLTKTHHCLVDGVGSVDAAYLLLDAEPHPAPDAYGPPSADGHHDGGLPLAIRGPLGAVKAGVHAALHPRETVERTIALGELVVRNELVAAPETSLNDPIGPRRTLRAVRIGLDETKAIRDALGGTVNDVALTAVTTGLRELLLSRGETPPEPGLRAMVPMNIRDDGHAALGNRISSLFVDLPVGEASLIARYEHVVHNTSQIKRSRAQRGADTLLHTVENVPPVVHQLLARSLYARRLFNITVTNVPGPQIPLYAFGARMRCVWPLVPIAADHGLGIAIMSYDGQLMFGVNADTDSVPDVDVLTEGLAAGLRDLQRLARRVPAGAAR